MSNNPHRCVIDKDDYYTTLVWLQEQERGGIVLYDYTLNPDESLIEAPPPFGMVHPRWNEITWEEAATREEIAAHEDSRAQENQVNM